LQIKSIALEVTLKASEALQKLTLDAQPYQDLNSHWIPKWISSLEDFPFQTVSLPDDGK
jgi:hypothetical protein